MSALNREETFKSERTGTQFIAREVGRKSYIISNGASSTDPVVIRTQLYVRAMEHAPFELVKSIANVLADKF